MKIGTYWDAWQKIKEDDRCEQKHQTGNLDCSLCPLDFCMTLRFGKKLTWRWQNGLMLHTYHGMLPSSVGGVGYYSINNGQEKTLRLRETGLKHSVKGIALLCVIIVL